VRRAFDQLAPTLGLGPSVAGIVVQGSLRRAGDAGLRAAVSAARRDGAPAYVVWLASKPAGTYLGPEGVAAVLSDVLLTLAECEQRVALVLEVPVAVPATTPDCAGVAPRPRAVAHEEAEGTLIAFPRSLLGHEAPTPNGA
jgi:hypothetical protein